MARIIKAYLSKKSSLSLSWSRKRYFKTKINFCLQAWLEFASERFKLKLSTRDILKRVFWVQQLEKAWHSRVWTLVDLRIDYIAIIIAKSGMWKRKRKLEAEAVEVVTFLWKRKRKYFEERSWKRKRTRKHLNFWGSGSGSIFHETWCFRFL